MVAQSTRITLIRHGETQYNRTNRYMGRLEEGLNATGREQAARAAGRLARHSDVEVLITSPLERTRETTGFLERALGRTAEADDGFLEVDLGPWQGRDRSEVAAEDPERWKLWLTEPARVRVQGMESIGELRDRVGEALDRVGERHAGRHVAVVTHFACVATAVLHVLDLPNSAYRRFPVGNASFTSLRLAPFPALLRFNDTAHLEGLAVESNDPGE